MSSYGGGGYGGSRGGGGGGYSNGGYDRNGGGGGGYSNGYSNGYVVSMFCCFLLSSHAQHSMAVRPSRLGIVITFTSDTLRAIHFGSLT